MDEALEKFGQYLSLMNGEDAIAVLCSLDSYGGVKEIQGQLFSQLSLHCLSVGFCHMLADVRFLQNSLRKNSSVWDAKVRMHLDIEDPSSEISHQVAMVVAARHGRAYLSPGEHRILVGPFSQVFNSFIDDANSPFFHSGPAMPFPGEFSLRYPHSSPAPLAHVNFLDRPTAGWLAHCLRKASLNELVAVSKVSQLRIEEYSRIDTSHLISLISSHQEKVYDALMIIHDELFPALEEVIQTSSWTGDPGNLIEALHYASEALVMASYLPPVDTQLMLAPLGVAVPEIYDVHENVIRSMASAS